MLFWLDDSLNNEGDSPPDQSGEADTDDSKNNFFLEENIFYFCLVFKQVKNDPDG
jgi:hypothetical protein